MANRRAGSIWRFISFSAAPFLALLAVLLLVREETVSKAIGVLAAVATAASLLTPLLIRQSQSKD